jgi:hypothetical protein
MKLELSKNGCVIEINKIEVDGNLINFGSIEPGRAFLAYPILDPKNAIQKEIAKNFVSAPG